MTNRELQEEADRAVKEAEGFCAAAVNPARHPNAHKYLPGLRETRITFRGFAAAAESEGDTAREHRFRLVLSEIDQLESEYEGRR